MHVLDIVILVLSFAGMLSVGLYFHRRQTGLDEYFAGGRDMSARQIGLSVVATDVGGGFSIGLGGLGFVMGLSASWLLFSGLIGAWLAAADTDLPLDPVFYGMAASGVVLVLLTVIRPNSRAVATRS